MVTFEMVIRELADSENDRHSEKTQDKGYAKLAGIINKTKKALYQKDVDFVSYIYSMSMENLDVMHDYDDYLFAWLLSKDEVRQSLDTISIYNAATGGDFLEWFLSRCEPDEDGTFNPGQKWHLFEFILYGELNNKYNINKKLAKIDVKKDDVRFSLWNQRYYHFGLWRWIYSQLPEPETPGFLEDMKYTIDTVCEIQNQTYSYLKKG